MATLLMANIARLTGIQVDAGAGGRTHRQRAPLSPEEFGVAYDRYHRDLFGYFVRQTQDLERAADLLQITFERMWTSRQSYRGTSDSELRGWLRAIARSVVRDGWLADSAQQKNARRLPKRGLAFSDHELERLENLDADEQFRARVLDRLAQLPEEQQDAVRLRIIDGLSYDEVAKRMNSSSASARQRVSRGLKQLRAWLDSDYADWLKDSE